MKTSAILLAAALALPAAAQVVPDEFPDADEPVIDRVRRDLVERHRPFLSGLYASSAFAAGPRVGELVLYGAVATDVGYRFGSGDALAVQAALQSPLDRAFFREPGSDRLAGALGVEAVLGLRRFAAPGSLLERAEVGLGLGVTAYEVDPDAPDVVGLYGERSGTVVTPVLTVTPRVALPLTPTLSAPVGLRIGQELSSTGRPGPFVGFSVGLRRIFADEARMVLE